MNSFAMDGSVRSFDRDGRLHVSKSAISKAAVNTYFGHEIPKYKALGLDPNAAYKLFRDPEELKKAAHTFNNIPILDHHVPDTADAPATQRRVGTTGSDAQFEYPYLTNSLAVWNNDAIAGIETDEFRELSSGYYYEVDPTPGIFEGQPYDFRMTNISGNHVAFVKKGRAGPDVLVWDSQPIFEGKNMPIKYKTILQTLQKHGIEEDRLEEISRSILDELHALDQEETETEVEETNNIIIEPEEEEKVEDENTASPPRDDDADEKHSNGGGLKKIHAMDANTMLRSLREQIRRDYRLLEQAKEAVRPLVGSVGAMDSADEVYAFALKSAGVEYAGVHPSAYPALIQMAVKHQSKTSAKPSFALDSAAHSTFNAMFPNATLNF